MNKLTMLTLSLLLASAGSLLAIRPGQGGHGIRLATGDITIINKGEPVTLRLLYLKEPSKKLIPSTIANMTNPFSNQKIEKNTTVHIPLYTNNGILQYVDVVYDNKANADLISEEVISAILAGKMNKTTFEIRQDSNGKWVAEAQ